MESLYTLAAIAPPDVHKVFSMQEVKSVNVRPLMRSTLYSTRVQQQSALDPEEAS